MCTRQRGLTPKKVHIEVLAEPKDSTQSLCKYFGHL